MAQFLQYNYNHPVEESLHIKRLELRIPITHKVNPCLFVCFGSVNAFVPRGQLPRKDLRRAPLPPATPHRQASSIFMFPFSCTFVMRPASGPYPSLSCTYNLSSIWSVPSLSSRYTHIFKPLKYEPLNNHQTPHINCITLLFPTKTQNNSSVPISPLLYPPRLPVPGPSLTPVASLPLYRFV